MRHPPVRTVLRVPGVLSAVAILPLLLWASTTGAQTLDAARTAFLEGRYEEALDSYRTLARSDGAPSAVRHQYARALMEVGRYEDAAEVVRGPEGHARSPALETVLGEALYAVGRIEAAEAAFRRAVDAGVPNRNVALGRLGVLLWNRGERSRAREIFDSFIDLYNEGAERLSAEELMAVGTAVKYLGPDDPALYRDALRAYDEAASAAPDDPRPDLLAGLLFLEKYNSTDARTEFDEVLRRNEHQPDALLGRARALDFDGEPAAMAAVRKALESNPRHVEARAFLARMHLRTGDYGRARAEAGKALEVNPNSLEALTALAATHYLRADTSAYRDAVERVRAVNPIHPDLYATVAELAADLRRYPEAVELTRRAVEMDSTSSRALGLLGINQLRLGAIEEGRSHLERAFEGDPYNPWFKNTLDLLDTFDRYETVRTDHFALFIHGEEAALLGPYARRVAEEAWSALGRRYGSEPDAPLRVELFPSHADFSVRTMGLVGLGALGVSFGNTLVMDSPAAREPGDFNWESTLWHELAHSFHLALTEHRVPRWFSEGLAVHEQRTADERWGHKPSPGWLQAYRTGRLYPVSRLDEGFVRPDYPRQVVYSYYQASLVFELMESRWGFDAILAMLRGYRKGRTTAELFPEVVGMELEEFDEVFDDYVRNRLGARMAAVASVSEEAATPLGPGNIAATSLEALRRQARQHPGSFQARLALGRALYEDHRPDEAEEELRAALRLFPEYGGPGSPYLYLARIHRERGDLEQAADALYQLGRLDESRYEVHVEEAEIRLELGQTEAAAQALGKAVEIFPYDPDLHRRLAELYTELGEHGEAVVERRAVLALDPVDRADAHYRLAAALARSGHREEARTQVLEALEIAPRFDEALELLLELRGGGMS